MKNFHVGQRVICIDASPGWETGEIGLIKDKVYVVLATFEVFTHQDKVIPTIRVEQTADRCWASSRFRPITDISIFTDMLKRKLEPVD